MEGGGGEARGVSLGFTIKRTHLSYLVKKRMKKRRRLIDCLPYSVTKVNENVLLLIFRKRTILKTLFIIHLNDLGHLIYDFLLEKLS